MEQTNWEIAHIIALGLVKERTDVNEIQKVVTNLRVHAERHPEQVGKRLFSLLDTIIRDGRFLVRSGQTLNYYRGFRDICVQHLSNFRTTTTEQGRELVEVLGWAARLMRYYNSEEGAAELSSRQSHAGKERQHLAEPREQRLEHSPPPPARRPQATQPRPRQATPPPPRVENVRETVTLLTSVKTGKARVRTDKGEEITCAGMPPYPPAQAGETCRADVTREGGRAIKAFFKGWAA